MKKGAKTMAKTLQIGLAAVLVSAGVALAIPAYAASSKAVSTKDSAASGTVDLQHTSTKAAGLKGKRLATVDRNERRITAELNKQAMSGQSTTGQQSSLDSNTSQQQASAQTDSETTTQ
jgi:hypothetical protein